LTLLRSQINAALNSLKAYLFDLELTESWLPIKVWPWKLWKEQHYKKYKWRFHAESSSEKTGAKC